jgi:hypothetical protein
MEAMLSKFVDAIASLKDAEKSTMHEVVTNHGHELLVHRDGRILFDATHEPDPKPLKVGSPIGLTTLTGLAAFVKEKIAAHTDTDGENGAEGDVRPMFLHVVSPTKVVLASALTFGPLHQRETFAVAEVKRPQFPYGNQLDPEAFILAALTNLVENDERQRMLEFVSRITSGPVTVAEDDGVGQSVTVSMGVSGAIKGANAFKNPVELEPYRTFREVDQPASPFVLRFSGGGPNQKPTIALHAADAGHWEIDAIENVKKWLTEAKLDIPVVA